MNDSKNYAAFKALLHLFAGLIGLKDLLPEPDRALSFKDQLMRDRKYFSGGYMLRTLVIDGLPGKKGKLNDETAYAIFDEVFCQLYASVKARVGPITQTLDKYLTEDDFQSAWKGFTDFLAKANDRFRVILVTNMIALRGIESVQIGNVLLRRVDGPYLSKWPESCDHAETRGLLFSAFTNPAYYASRDRFLENNKEHSALEVTIEGHHFEEEKSTVFDSAATAFKRVFAYLSLCELFFSNVKGGEYKIETRDLPTDPFFTMTEPKGQQYYYLFKLGDPAYFKAVDTRWNAPTLSRRTFVFTEELLTQLTERYYLKKFNDIFQNNTWDEIISKLARCLDWYLKAELESDFTDEALSLFISLETLLSSGGDALMSHTDDMAENVAIMVQSTVDERYRWKKYFKKRYGLRNKIAHHGATLDRLEHWAMVRDLRADIVWSVRGIPQRLDDIRVYGGDTSAMRQYFEREKLRGS